LKLDIVTAVLYGTCTVLVVAEAFLSFIVLYVQAVQYVLYKF